jgi:EAL domain-containing protein (putative c-di-GMP-specific phosphodiesterase class I)/ActR/RegA family two-component response regulator
MKSQISKLLVVDDEIMQCRIIEAVAVRKAIEVTFVSTFDAAMRELRAKSFDCVSVDLTLGEHSGVELLRAISELPVVPFVIIVSGCDDRIMNATVRMAHDVGIPAVASMTKPIDIVRLREILTAARRSDRQKAIGQRILPDICGARLEQAVRNREIHAAFQPKIDFSSGRIIGCEALARWTCSDLGTIPPDIFIAVAERSGQIKALTLLMLEDAIGAGKHFVARDSQFVMSVNISGSLVSDESLPDEIEAILLRAGAAPRNLMLEITETTAMADASRAIDVLLGLRLKGIGLSIDDFGTGYSSLSVLARMPFNELKIDRSFVTHCLQDTDMWKIVRGSIALAHGFGMTAVAEGIEDIGTAEALAEIGCDIGQGYFLAPALSASDFSNWCNARCDPAEGAPLRDQRHAASMA